MPKRNPDERPGSGSSEEGQRRSRRRTAIILLSAALPVLLGLYLIALYWARPATFGEQLRLDEFLTLTASGRIQDAIILDQDNRVIGQSDRGPFWVAFGNRETTFSRVLSALEGGAVPTTLRQQWSKSLIVPLTILLPALLMIDALLLIILIFRNRSDSLEGFGKSTARKLGTGEAKITFGDVAGLDEAVEELVEIRDYLEKPDQFLAMGAAVPKGILLSGPPGCGKTLLARAVAGEAGVPFFSISGAEFAEMYVGVGSARIRDLFKTAKAHAPCIVFIDELDAVGRNRGSAAIAGQEERETTLNQLLVEMDGFEANTGVVVLAATNRPDVLDSALLRPGRFDRRVTIDRPDVKGRLGVLKIHARGKPFGDSVDLEVVAKRTPGFSGADLANIVNEAALLAARRQREEITQAELVEAIERVVAGPERKTRVLTPRDRRIIAYHEAGHAVVSAAMANAEIVHKVSIVSRGHAGGMTWFSREEEWLLAARSELEERLAVLLAGRAAEELLTGDPTNGAKDDLEQAGRLARRMVADFGMGERLLPAAYEDGYRRDSDRRASAVDAQVERLLDVGMERARAALTTHRKQWEAIANKLQEVETLEGPDLELMLAEVNGHAAPGPRAADDLAGAGPVSDRGHATEA